MTSYWIGVILAYIIYRWMRFYDAKHPGKAEGTVTYIDILICYVIIASSWLGVIIFSIVIMKNLKIHKKEPPNWL